MTSVLVADDHAVVRAGYRQFLGMDAKIDEVGEAGSAAEALAQLHGRSWSLLLLDIHWPDRAGIALVQDVKAKFPKMPVLVISGLPEEQFAVEALRAGASGFLSKDVSHTELLSAVRRVLNGQLYISSRLAEQLVSDLGKPSSPRHEQLSRREREVFGRIAAGATITAVATELHLSVKTISTYRTRLMEKMNFKSNADITSYAVRNGMQ